MPYPRRRSNAPNRPRRRAPVRRPAPARPRRMVRRRRTPAVRYLRPSGHGNPLPNRLITKLQYTWNGGLETSDSVPGICGLEQVFRLNSIYDPNYTESTGANNTSVVGYGFYATLYQKYLVKGVTAKIVWNDPSIDGIVCCASLNQESVLQATAIRTVMERARNYTYPLNHSGSQKKTVTYSIKPWAILGITRLEWMANASQYAADIAGNPTQALYLRIATSMANPDSYSAVSATAQATVTLTYDVELYQPLTLTP